MGVDIYPCWDWSCTLLVKGVPDIKTLRMVKAAALQSPGMTSGYAFSDAECHMIKCDIQLKFVNGHFRYVTSIE